jgi:hypothetical protein
LIDSFPARLQIKNLHLPHNGGKTKLWSLAFDVESLLFSLKQTAGLLTLTLVASNLIPLDGIYSHHYNRLAFRIRTDLFELNYRASQL